MVCESELNSPAPQEAKRASFTGHDIDEADQHCHEQSHTRRIECDTGTSAHAINGNFDLLAIGVAIHAGSVTKAAAMAMEHDHRAGCEANQTRTRQSIRRASHWNSRTVAWNCGSETTRRIGVAVRIDIHYALSLRIEGIKGAIAAKGCHSWR